MPSNKATAVLYEEYMDIDHVSIITWHLDEQLCIFPVKRYIDNAVKDQSITLQQRNGYEHLLWSGMERSNQFSPMYLMTQRGAQGGGYNQTCHNYNDDSALPVTLKHSTLAHDMPIQIRYEYDSVTYPLTLIQLKNIETEKQFPCIK